MTKENKQNLRLRSLLAKQPEQKWPETYKQPHTGSTGESEAMILL